MQPKQKILVGYFETRIYRSLFFMSTCLAILNTLWMVEQQSQEEELCYLLWRNSLSEHFADPGKTTRRKKLKQICRNLDY